MQQHIVYIEIGGNIEPRLDYINKTKSFIESRVGNITNESAIFESPPWGFEADQSFLNQCIEVKTQLEPDKLITETLAIEKELGRVRTGTNYESRTVDIDLLLFNSLKIKNARLEVPHPRMHLRKFVLLPLSQIAGSLIHPTLNKSIDMLLDECNDESICNKF